MRIAYTAFVALLAASAVPSVAFAQVFLPESRLRHDLRLDHVVPAATVAWPGQPIALADAHPVQDASGAPFVLGAATVDVSDPYRATIVVTLTNTRETPIPWNRVYVWPYSVWRDQRGVVIPSIDGIPRSGTRGRDYPGYGVTLSAWDLSGTWQPGATITVHMPIAQVPKKGEGELQSFLVYVEFIDRDGEGRPRLKLFNAETDSMLRRAVLHLPSQAHQ